MFIKSLLFSLYTGIIISCSCKAEYMPEDEIEEGRGDWGVLEDLTQAIKKPDENEIEGHIIIIETISLTAQNLEKMHISTPEDIEKLVTSMLSSLDNLHKAIKVSDNIKKFIEAQGILRILSKNLANKNPKLRNKLLLILRDIFDLTPINEDIMPLNLIDRLLEIFENDDMELKSQALNILCKWLPNNPRAQVRVIKIRGLETFYDQLGKLDEDLIQTLIDLFNTIVKEHFNARNNKVLKADSEELMLYQRMGLLERVSTPAVCNGLLNVLEMLWSHNTEDESKNIKTIVELVITMKPCAKIIMHKPKAADIFLKMLNYFKDEEKQTYFKMNDVNVAEFVDLLEKYLDQQMRLIPRDEF